MANKNAREYSIWRAIPHSFAFGDLYRDVAKNWKGTGFLYIFLILVFLCVPRAIRFHSDMSQGIAEGLPKFMETIPDFELKNGQLSVNVKQPFYYPDPKEPVFVIDTTGKITSLSQVKWAEKTDSVILMTKTQMMTQRVRFGVPEEETADLSKIANYDLNKDSLRHFAEFMGRWSGWIAYPFLLWGLFLYNMVAMAFYGLIGWILSKSMNVTLDYVGAMRLAAVSHTPSLVLATALATADIEMPLGFFFFLALSTFLLFLALRTVANQDSSSKASV